MKRILFLLIPLFLFSCSGYEKLLKSSDYKLKYKKALEYYKKEDFIKSSTLFDQLAPVLKGTNQGDTVAFYLAMSYLKQNDYILAEHYFSDFIEKFANSDFIEDSYFFKAYCLYLQSPRPELDQSPTYNAILAFQLFLVKFPETVRKKECLDYVIELREKLVEKSFISAKLYFDLEDFKASIVALNNSINEYPESKYREEIMFLILKSNFLLAINSIQSKQKERYQTTLDEYYSFVTEFPKSKYKKDADRIYDAVSKNVTVDDQTKSN